MRKCKTGTAGRRCSLGSFHNGVPSSPASAAREPAGGSGIRVTPRFSVKKGWEIEKILINSPH